LPHYLALSPENFLYPYPLLHPPSLLQSFGRTGKRRGMCLFFLHFLPRRKGLGDGGRHYFTVTLFAKFLGISVPHLAPPGTRSG